MQSFIPNRYFSFSRYLVLVAALSTVLACGGDDDGPTTPAEPRQVSGRVTKGAVFGAAVTLHAIASDGTPGAQVAGPFTTAGDGSWSGELDRSAEGPFLIIATGGSYVDEVSGATYDLGTRSLLGFSDDGSGQATPFTHALLVAMAARMEAGASATAAWNSVLATFESAFGFDPSETAPATSGSTAARTYYALLGGLSELLGDDVALASVDGAEPIDLVLAFAADLSDGALDGAAAGGEPIVVAAADELVAWPGLDLAGIDALIAAVNAFAASTTGLSDIVLGDVDLDFNEPPTGSGSGSVSFSGPGASLLGQTTFEPTAFSENATALAWATGLANFSAQIGVSRALDDPTRASIVTVTTVIQGGQGLGWSATAFQPGTFVPGVTIDGTNVTFDGVSLPGLTGTETTLTLNGALGE